MAKKLNQIELNKKVDDGLRRRFTYIVPNSDKIEFISPEENHLNRMLNHNPVLRNVDENGKSCESGAFGQVKVFYLSSKEHSELIKLFEDFGIPNKAHRDLLLAYLNMVIAACEAPHANSSYQEQDKTKDELVQTMNFLETLGKDDYWLRGLTLEYQKKLDKKGTPGKNVYGPLKSFKIKGHVAVQFLEMVLQNYKAAKNYSIAKDIADMYIQYGKPDIFMGHKNAEKHSQSYYSSILFTYIRRELFSGAFDFLSDNEKYQEEVKRLHQLYPRNRIFLFIGKLMAMSGLLGLKPDSDDIAITETIRKKLRPRLQNEKKKQQQISEHNANPTDGMIHIQLFDELF